ncbi:hypothetical protein BBP00_00008628 [Phytophthora kernoviae]|uniref:RxLR effector protein n=1 Tax=Phytophthora kernoviae TaxID=325452 RepID=A0A3F2REV7_9STRA|nr:hypothetical protein BBP00_00008628 [Phytophthora kernoviae]
MRPYNVLLLTLALLFAFSNAVLAVTPATVTAVNNEANYKRSLRAAETTTNSVDDEERGLVSGYSKVMDKAHLLKMRLGANKEINFKDAAVAKIAKAEKAVENAKLAEAAKLAKAEAKATAKADKVAKAAEKAKAAKVAKAAKADAAKAAKLAKAEAAAAAKVAKEEKDMARVKKLVDGWTAELVSPKKPPRRPTMRPYYVLLLTLTLLFAFTNAAPEDTSDTARSLTAVNNEGNSKRSLRITDPTEEDEERLLNLGQLTDKIKLAKMRRSGAKEIKAVDKAKAVEAAKAAKLVKATEQAKEERSMVTGWLNKLITPEKAYKDLGLTGLGARATGSKNYRIYEDYLPQYHQRVDAFF